MILGFIRCSWRPGMGCTMNIIFIFTLARIKMPLPATYCRSPSFFSQILCIDQANIKSCVCLMSAQLKLFCCSAGGKEATGFQNTPDIYSYQSLTCKTVKKNLSIYTLGECCSTGRHEVVENSQFISLKCQEQGC